SLAVGEGKLHNGWPSSSLSDATTAPRDAFDRFGPELSWTQERASITTGHFSWPAATWLASASNGALMGQRFARPRFRPPVRINERAQVPTPAVNRWRQVRKPSASLHGSRKIRGNRRVCKQWLTWTLPSVVLHSGTDG